MGRKLRTKAGRAHYARRKAIVEPVFGQIKEARGFRRFSLRGLEAVQAEWLLVAAVHNLGKLFRSGQSGRVLQKRAIGSRPAPGRPSAERPHEVSGLLGVPPRVEFGPGLRSRLSR